VTNGHSTCGANVLITDYVNGNLMEPDYTTLRVEGPAEGAIIKKTLPNIGSTVTFTASFKLGFGETAKLVYSVSNRWRPLSEWPPYANRGVELGRGQVKVELVGKCGVRSTAASTSPSHFLVGNTFSVSTSSPFLHVPHPDMSMPFNVITLTGTVIAFIVGTVFNVTVRNGGKAIKEKLSGKKKGKESALNRKFNRLDGTRSARNSRRSYIRSRRTTLLTNATILTHHPNPFCDSLRSSQADETFPKRRRR